VLEQAQETAAADEAANEATTPVARATSTSTGIATVNGAAMTAETPREPEPEPEDEVPPEYRVPAYATGPAAPFVAAPFLEPQRLRGPGIALRTVAYSAAITWPFLGTAYEYYTLNGSGASTNICDQEGCVLAGTEFAHQALPWLLPASAVSTLLVMGWNKAVRQLRDNARLPAPEDEKPPVPKIVIAGGFVALCALAFVVGILRGMMISHLGH
jgi:hypothetical protein